MCQFFFGSRSLRWKTHTVDRPLCQDTTPEGYVCEINRQWLIMSAHVGGIFITLCWINIEETQMMVQLTPTPPTQVPTTPITTPWEVPSPAGLPVVTQVPASFAQKVKRCWQLATRILFCPVDDGVKCVLIQLEANNGAKLYRNTLILQFFIL